MASLRGLQAVFAFVGLGVLAGTGLAAVYPVSALSVGSASQRLGALAFSLAADRSTYEVGVPVRLMLTLKNTALQPAVVEFPSSQHYDVLILRDGRSVWQWSAGKAFLQAFTRVSLGPGESRAFQVTWDQRDASSRQVPAGEYVAEARFPVAGIPPIRTQTRFRITTPSGRLGTVVMARAIGGLGEVVVNGMVVLRIRLPAGGLRPIERATVVALRLRTLLDEGLRSGDLRVGLIGRDAAVVARGRLIVTADASHARLNATTPAALARVWRDQLTRALTP